MARWKVVTYLTDECQEHTGPQGCTSPPDWWDDDEYGEYEIGSDCYYPVEPGDLDNRKSAENIMNFFFTYGTKHQHGGFTNTTIEPVN